MHRAGQLVAIVAVARHDVTYGDAGMKRRLAELRLVWISHIHADHHAGLPSVLAARQQVRHACRPMDTPL
eukprot:305078-Prorocentrum_minimum.AAC.2